MGEPVWSSDSETRLETMKVRWVTLGQSLSLNPQCQPQVTTQSIFVATNGSTLG